MADSSGGGPNRPKPHIYVPMPEPEATYPRVNTGNTTSSKRDLLIRQFGEVSVMHAEVAVCVNVIIQLGLLKKSEFVGMVEEALARADYARQRHAESGGREG